MGSSWTILVLGMVDAVLGLEGVGDLLAGHRAEQPPAAPALAVTFTVSSLSLAAVASASPSRRPPGPSWPSPASSWC